MHQLLRLARLHALATRILSDAEIALSGIIGTPTNTTAADLHNTTGSPGVIQGGVITDDGDGTITVSAMMGMIRATDNDTAPLLSFDVVETSLSPNDEEITYIYSEYNGGSPRIIATSIERPDHNTNNILGTAYRNGTNMHLTPRAELIGNMADLVNERLIDTDNLSWVSGSAISETGTRNLAGTAGAYWLGLNNISVVAFDTDDTDTFFYFYRDGGGGWTFNAVATTISNTEYDDGTGDLEALTGSRYGVHWVYVGVDNHIYVLYGRGNYTLAGAEDALPPSDLPPHLQEHHGVLAAKIIVQRDAASFTSIESAFGVKFSAAGIQDHGDLAGLADNDHPQYQLAALSPNVQTGTSYTLLDSDNGKIVTLNNGSAIAVALDTGLAVGFQCTLVQLGAGQVTVGGTATLNHSGGHGKTSGQYAEVGVKYYAADSYILSGDTAA